MMGSKTYNGGATGSRKKFDDIFSRVDTIHQRGGRTDRHRTSAKTALTHSVKYTSSITNGKRTDL